MITVVVLSTARGAQNTWNVSRVKGVPINIDFDLVRLAPMLLQLGKLKKLLSH